MSLTQATAPHPPDSTVSSWSATAPPKRSRWMVWLAILVVALGLGGTAAWWFGFRTKDASVATATTTTVQRVVDVTSGTVTDTVSAEGTVAAATTDDLSFTSSGTVTAVNVAVGDTVTAGEVLATIDSAQLLATSNAAQATLADAQAKLADDTDADASDEQIASDNSAITVAYDAALKAYVALGGASLVATTDGTVTAMNLTVDEQLGSSGAGGTTQSGSGTGAGGQPGAVGSSTGSTGSTSSTAQIQVISTGKFSVSLAVDSAGIASVAVGQTVNLTVSSATTTTTTGGFGGGNFPGGNFPGGTRTGTGSGIGTGTGTRTGTGTGTTTAAGTTATGTITEVSKIATTTSGVASYPVTVTFTADPATWFIGTTVTGAIVTAERTGVIQVPTQAITTTGATSTVVVSSDGTTTGPTETQTVTLGTVSGNMTEITAGLTVGEHVIVEITGRFPTGAGTGSANNEGGQAPTGEGFPGGGAPTGEGFPGGGGAPTGAPAGAPTGAPTGAATGQAAG